MHGGMRCVLIIQTGIFFVVLVGNSYDVQFLADFTVVRFRSPGGGGGKTAKFHVVSFSVLPDRLPVRPRSSMHRLLAGRPRGRGRGSVAVIVAAGQAGRLRALAAAATRRRH